MVHCVRGFITSQVEPEKYGNMIKGFRVSINEGGVFSLSKGWAPTFIGYSIQGLGKFGLYEIFKFYYSQLLGEVSSNVIMSTWVSS